MRVDLIGHFKPCMTDIYIHIDARMAAYLCAPLCGILYSTGAYCVDRQISALSVSLPASFVNVAAAAAAIRDVLVYNYLYAATEDLGLDCGLRAAGPPARQR